MKFTARFITLSLAALSLGAWGEEQCVTTLRPAVGEVAFVTPGATLFNTSERCLKEVLVIPYTQSAGAVTLEEGAYPLIKRRGSLSHYALTGTNGKGKIESCPVCDPLKELTVEKRSALCVTSDLNVISCASPGALSFVFGTEVTEKDNVATDNLVYAGREGEVVRFEAYNPEGAQVATVSYDLSQGRVLRYLNLRFEVLEADNQGLYFTRRELQPDENKAKAPSR